MGILLKNFSKAAPSHGLGLGSSHSFWEIHKHYYVKENIRKKVQNIRAISNPNSCMQV
jgi:alpha-L-fucosidase